MGAAACCTTAASTPPSALRSLAEQGVTVLCQSPTEYRMIAKRASLDGLELPALRRLVSAGEPLNPEVIAAFDAALGLDDP